MEEGAVLQVTYMGTQLTANLLGKIIAAVYGKGKRMTKSAINKAFYEGKQSKKNLVRQNGETLAVPLEDSDLKEIQRELKRSGVDFSVEKQVAGGYNLWFKARDSSVIESAFKNIVAKTTLQQNKKEQPNKHKQPISERIENAKREAARRKAERVPNPIKKGAITR